MLQAHAEELWRLIYNTFEATSLDAGRTMLVTKGQANEMQFALMNRVAALKHTTARNEIDSLADQIYSDFLAMEAVGLMSSETIQSVERILSQIKE